MKTTLTFLSLLLSLNVLFAANYYTISDGAMNSTSKWRGNNKPSGWNSADKWSGSPKDTVFVRNEMTAPSYAVNGPSIVLVIEAGGLLDVKGNMSMNNSTLIIKDGGTLNASGGFTTSNTSGSDIVISGSMNVADNLSQIAGKWEVTETGFLNVGGDFNNNTGAMSFNNAGAVAVLGDVSFHDGDFNIAKTGSFYSEGTSVTVGHANIVNEGYMGFLKATSINTWSGTWDCDGTSGLGSVAFGETVNCATICNGGGSESCGSNVSVSPALPVTWLDVIAIDIDGEVVIEWSTASEENNDYFIVEKSLDGETWIPVNAVEGAGNSSEPLYYSSVDFETVNELTYYRIMQVDYDGQYEYSKIVVYIPTSTDYNVGLYPNPNIGAFYIDLGEDQLKAISILNIQGNSIDFEMEQVNNLVKIKLQNTVPEGFYSVVTVTNKGVAQNNFVKK